MDPDELMQKLAAIVAKKPSGADVVGAKDLAAWGQEQLQKGLSSLRQAQADLAAQQAAVEAAAKAAQQARAAAPQPPPASAAPTMAPPPAAPTPEPFARGPLEFVPEETTAEIVQRYPLEPAAQALRKDPQLPRAFLDALLAAGLHAEAVRFLSFGLPRQLAVLWGGLCADWVTPAAQLPPSEHAALAAAMRCVMTPTEELQRAAEAPARAAGVNTPSGSLAMAVFSGGASLAAANLPPVPPPPSLSNQLAHAAIRIALGRAKPEQAKATLRQFLVMGICIAVHGPLAPCAHNDVRGRIRDLFRALNLLPAGKAESSTSQEVWDYLETHGDSRTWSGIRRN